VKQATSTTGNPAEVRSSAVISAQVGKELALNGVWARGVRGRRLPDLHIVSLRMEVRGGGDHHHPARRGGGGGAGSR
jgi:hypothetical protein